MNAARFFSFIVILLVLGITTFPNAYGAGKWKVLRNDDMVRKDGVEGNLQDVHCIDEKHAWVVGHGGLILHTTDGGKIWTKRTIESESPADFLRIYFSSLDLGFITGSLPARRGIRALLFMTRDGGKTWEAKDPGLRSLLTGIAMINEKVGFMVGSDNAYAQTADGGETWMGEIERVRLGEKRYDLWDISFPSPTHGWVVGSWGSIYHTPDGGQKWEDQYSGVDNDLRAVHFVDEKTGWTAGQEGIIFHTKDGGATWMQQQTNSYDNLNDIVFVDKQTGWAVGEFGIILYTTDGGQTWTRENTGTSTNLFGVDATGKNHCWAVGEWGLILGYGQ